MQREVFGKSVLVPTAGELGTALTLDDIQAMLDGDPVHPSIKDASGAFSTGASRGW